MADKQKYMEVLKHYVGDNKDRETYFGMWGSLDDISMTENEDTRIELNGPFGHYQELIDCKLFQEMADICPEGSFRANIAGEGTYDSQSLDCELKDGLLAIETHFIDCESMYEDMDEMDEDEDADFGLLEDEMDEVKYYTYDPIQKKYLDNKPTEKGPIILNDAFKEVLAKEGKPHSDEDIANLSLEEAYDLLFKLESEDNSEESEVADIADDITAERIYELIDSGWDIGEISEMIGISEKEIAEIIDMEYDDDEED